MPGVNCQFSRRRRRQAREEGNGKKGRGVGRPGRRLTETLASANMGNDTRKSLVNNSLDASLCVCVVVCLCLCVKWPLLSTSSSSSSAPSSLSRERGRRRRLGRVGPKKICDTRRSFNRRMQILSRLPRKTTLRRGAKGAAAAVRIDMDTPPRERDKQYFSQSLISILPRDERDPAM